MNRTIQTKKGLIKGVGLDAGEKIAAKIMPRFPTSPLLIGYDMRILPSNLPKMVEDFRKHYL